MSSPKHATLLFFGVLIHPRSPTSQVVAWYDNEWGYSQRVVDLAEITAQRWVE
jgi:glyceraldehyde-3-phosphate dehydrogenase/erythrose-4-phosphate dehydrogenase